MGHRAVPLRPGRRDGGLVRELGDLDAIVYRIYIVIAASLVGFLGLGTLYLVARKRKWGDYYFVFLVACMVVFFVGTFTPTST